ncbi:MAG TPA: V-type ATP synthase subunit F [Thermodesulfovibrionales bacterium]|nr:V-type ATP synthase subunit F [Thermodesulfovibrionales bacterium]
MKRIVFITAPDAEYGFRLAGVVQYTGRPEDAEGTLKEIMTDPATGLVILDERLMKGIAEERLREIEKVWQGIVLILPAPEKAGALVEDYVARLIRRAIGYHVRLQL